MQAIKCRVGGLKCRVPRGRVKSAQLWFVWRVRGRGVLKPRGLGFELQLDFFLLLQLGRIQVFWHVLTATFHVGGLHSGSLASLVSNLLAAQSFKPWRQSARGSA